MSSFGPDSFRVIIIEKQSLNLSLVRGFYDMSAPGFNINKFPAHFQNTFVNILNKFLRF